MAAMNIKSKVLTIFSYIVLFALLVAVSFHFYYNLSGSNQWQFEREEDGVTVYSLKTSGNSIVTVKATVSVKASLASVVAFFQDQTVCPEFGCLDAEIIDRKSEQLYYSRFVYPFPLNHMDREFVVKSLFYQDKDTKELHYTHSAEPDKLALNSCCVRVSEFYVLWRVTPKGNGLVEIEMKRYFNPSVYIPDVLMNANFVEGASRVLSRLQGFLDREKYRDAKFTFIEEPLQ